MIGCANHISHSTYVWVIQEGHNCSFSRCTDLLRMICSLPIRSSLMVSIICRAAGDNLHSHLIPLVSLNRALVDSNKVYTCSPPSTFRASLTLPIDPAPICDREKVSGCLIGELQRGDLNQHSNGGVCTVLPKTKVPLGAGIVVLDLPDFPVALDSCADTIGAGPPPFATLVAILSRL